MSSHLRPSPKRNTPLPPDRGGQANLALSWTAAGALGAPNYFPYAVTRSPVILRHDGTSMRLITAQAGVNLAAINYHFGSKELLFQEVAISGRGGTDFGPALRLLARESRRAAEAVLSSLVTETTLRPRGAELSRALLSTGFPYDRHTARENNFAQFVRLQRRAGAVRRLGSAALDLSFVAAGWLDGYWEMKLKPWDIAAGLLLVREAGGQLSDWAGAPQPTRALLQRGEVLATNGHIHGAVAQVLRDTEHGVYEA